MILDLAILIMVVALCWRNLFAPTIVQILKANDNRKRRLELEKTEQLLKDARVESGILRVELDKEKMATIDARIELYKKQAEDMQ